MLLILVFQFNDPSLKCFSPISNVSFTTKTLKVKMFSGIAINLMPVPVTLNQFVFGTEFDNLSQTIGRLGDSPTF